MIMTLRSARSRQATIRRLRQGHQPRRGSALLVVMVLLAMLASLGVIFYLFAAQERQSSVYYSDAAKVRQYDLSVDTLMDFALEQLIVGPDVQYKNSALYGSRHTLMGNMLGLNSSGTGFDFAPYNGIPKTGLTATDWDINDSPSANGQNDPNSQALANLDPDYTYPDVNNVFLYYEGLDPLEGRRVIIPSFHRPQSLRGGASTNTWYSEPTFARRVLRPHTGHVFTPRPGQQLSGTPVSRYLAGFPTTPHDFDGDGVAGPQGVWWLREWKANTTFSAGDWIRPLTFDNRPTTCFECITAGSTGATEPNWDMAPNIGDTINNDGTIVWERRLLVDEYDVDNDNDGTREGVWLDLDFPPLEDASGQLFVPMFSFTVKDADGLLNLNVHGNMNRVWSGDMSLQAPFVYLDPLDPNATASNPSTLNPSVSRSNMGLTPGEVNPVWALNRRPTSDGSYPGDEFYTAAPLHWLETANREFQFLLQGRYTSSPSNLFPGRWGEDDLLYQAITNSSPRQSSLYAFDGTGSPLANPWPGPGQTRLDDNGDQQHVAGGWYGGSFAPFGHPMDFIGVGTYYQLDPTNPRYGKDLSDGGSGRLHWPSYNRFGNSSSGTAVTWPALTGSLMTALYNDSAETVVDGDDARPEDNIFGADEMRALHMHPTDFVTATGGNSRLTQLAPFNLDASTTNFNSGSSQRFSQDFRSKFTTRSWDRKQFALPLDSSTRTWAFSADADNDDKLEFPPSFGTTPYSATDPFRPTLRRLLQVEAGNIDEPQLGLRFNLNQLLVGPNGNPFPTYDPNAALPPDIQLSLRPLTAHPDPTTLGATQITDFGLNSYPANGNFPSLQQQEYWARIDRQLMARDIFMMLYTLGWRDTINPTDSATIAGSGAATMVRQMAQFAVNVVDSLDRDNIVTRFEYDTNPTNGWNVNDNPYDTTDGTDRDEVWGVERLDLTLSEALFVRSEQESSNIPFTEWDDSLYEQHFAYVELRNPGPVSVDLNTAAWRLEVGPDAYDTGDVDSATVSKYRRLELVSGTIAPGQIYTIGSAEHASSGTYPSVMKVAPTATPPGDWDTDTTTWIAPNQRDVDLDLRDTAQSTLFQLTDAAGAAVTSGALYDAAMATGTPRANLFVRLYRRVNPTRTPPSNASEEADNPYVLVDELYVDELRNSSGRGGTVDFASSDDATTISSKLDNLSSRERAEPFGGDHQNGYDYHAATLYANTLGLVNSRSPAEFLNWQRVLDRDFASMGELLNVLMGGFTLSTSNGPRRPLPGVITDLDSTTTSEWSLETNKASTTTVAGTAESFFLPLATRVDVSANVPNWHRFLGLLEVPTREHVGIPGFTDPVDYPRVPGKINLNSLRHPDVLAGLIDDPSVMRFQLNEDLDLDGTLDANEVDTNGNGTLDDYIPPALWRTDLSSAAAMPTSEPIISWWQGFLVSRDGHRSTSGAGNFVSPDPFGGLYLPGWVDFGSSSGASPFRDYASASGPYGTEKTLLRSWPSDDVPTGTMSPANPRQLFEIGSRDEHVGTDSAMNAVTKIDPYVRRRLLNKVMNNTTNRSNVFVVFASVKFFRASVAATGEVQVGEPLRPASDPARWQPEHRAFFVIDRSQLEKAYDRATGKIDFRPLVEFRQILQ